MLTRSGSARERALASDQRAGRWARAEARAKQRAFARRNWRTELLLAGGMLVLTAFAAYLMPSGFVRGAAAGAGVASTVAVLYNFVLLFSGTAPVIMGDQAEQWTSSQLRPLTKHGWKLVNHFGLGRGDQDHVLVGPGGVVLLETKWSASEWKLDSRVVFEASARLERSARQLRLWLAPHAPELEVRKVLVLWGKAERALQEAGRGCERPDETLVIAGSHLRSWALWQDRSGLSKEEVDRIWTAMEQHLVSRDAHEESVHPLPDSAYEMATVMFTSVVAGFASLWAVVSLTDQCPSRWFGFPISFAAIGLGLMLRQRGRKVAAVGTAVILGSSFWPLLVGVALIANL